MKACNSFVFNAVCCAFLACLFIEMWIVAVLVPLYLGGCGTSSTKESALLPRSVKPRDTFAEFKTHVGKFYELNGWGGSGPDWTHFDSAAKFAQSPVASSQVLTREGESLASVFGDAVQFVRNVMDTWMDQQARGIPIPSFSQSLTQLMAACRLIHFGSSRDRLSGLTQRDKDRLVRDGLRALQKVSYGEQPMVILTFKNEVGACRQRFEIAPEESEEKAVSDPKVCYQRALDSMEALAVIEAGAHRITRERRADLKNIFERVTRLMTVATALGRVAEDEFPKPVISVYPKLAKAYDQTVNLQRMFLNPPAMSVRERNDRAIDRLVQLEELLANIEAEIANQHEKELKSA